MLKAAATCNTEEIPDRLERLRKDVAEKAAVAKHVAEKYGFPLIELQGVFDAACEKAPPAYWAFDGVRPTACGYELVKQLWLKAFNRIK